MSIGVCVRGDPRQQTAVGSRRCCSLLPRGAAPAQIASSYKWIVFHGGMIESRSIYFQIGNQASERLVECCIPATAAHLRPRLLQSCVDEEFKMGHCKLVEESKDLRAHVAAACSEPRSAAAELLPSDC